MTKNEIIQGIKDLFSNRSVPPETTLAELREIGEEVDSCIDCLKSDGVE